MAAFPALNLQQWIEDNRHLLKPPVGNREVYPGGEFIVMVVGGPNSRRDYHLNHTPEFFYQIEGDIVLRLMENGVYREQPIRQGEIYLLPAGVPHSPQRGADTVGLVIEQKRDETHVDSFLWFCDNCHHQLHAEHMPVSDIVAQLPEVFRQFKANKALHTCPACGHEHEF